MSAETKLEIIEAWANEIRSYCSSPGPPEVTREKPIWCDEIQEEEFPYLNARAQADIARIQRVARGDFGNQSDYRGRT